MEFDKKFAYALTLTSSRLGLLGINFHKFTTQLWPSIIVRILFLLNISDGIRPNFAYALMLTRSSLIWLSISFLQIYNTVVGWLLLILSAQYLGKKLMEFDQVWMGVGGVGQAFAGRHITNVFV